MQKQLDHILTRELSRKDFLATIGFGIASLVGIVALHRILAGKSLHGNRYGSSGYGR